MRLSSIYPLEGDKFLRVNCSHNQQRITLRVYLDRKSYVKVLEKYRTRKLDKDIYPKYACYTAEQWFKEFNMDFTDPLIFE